MLFKFDWSGATNLRLCTDNKVLVIEIDSKAQNLGNLGTVCGSRTNGEIHLMHSLYCKTLLSHAFFTFDVNCFVNLQDRKSVV